MSSDWTKGPRSPRRRRDDDDEDEGGDDRPRFPSRGRRRGGGTDDEFDETPDGRPYVHDACGGVTVVSGGDFTHVCDPFRICTGTYCCTCEGFAPLDQVRWADTEELLSDYRARLKEATPAPLKVWRSGVGCGAGLVVGLLAGLLLHVGLKAQGNIAWYLVIGGVVGALVVAVAGGLILEAMYPIDYRRKR